LAGSLNFAFALLARFAFGGYLGHGGRADGRRQISSGRSVDGQRGDAGGR
jgi:hypothetical protein